MRGYFGIGVENLKTGANLGTLWRSAQNLGASFIFTIGRRYQDSRTDTGRAWRHVPLYQYEDLPHFLESRPREAMLVGVEFPHPLSRDLTRFTHPERCIYLLGAEDRGISKEALLACNALVHIPSSHCLNVAVAGSIVLYDRKAKS